MTETPAESILGPITPIRCTEPDCHWAAFGVPDKYASSRAQILADHRTAEHTPTTEPAPAAAWLDGDPLMEALAAAVYEQCGTDPVSSIVVDDPRNIAAVAATVARQVLGTTGQPETGRSCRRSDCLAPGHRFMLGSTVYTCTGEPTALPAPVDRAAILREAADAVLDIIGADARLPQTISGVYRAADHLRRLAGEAQQLAPAVTEEPTR